MLAAVIAVYLIVIFVAFILAEIAAYFWHRFFAHKSFVTDMLGIDIMIQSHRFHHQANLDHDASEDFVWIVLILSGFILGLGVVHYLGLLDWIDSRLLVILLLVTALVFILNWYVHLAIHTPGHWLQSYSLIKDIQTIHFVHHKHPRKNYAILNFSDTIFGTFSTGDFPTLQ